MKVAQIGLGAIGSIFARHLLRAQVDLVVFDKSPDRGNAAGRDGARVAPTIADAGGEAAAFEAAMPLMTILGKHYLHLGPVGTGATVKLISNYIAGLHNLVAAEAFALGRAAGITIDTMLNTFAHTDANSYWLFNYF